MKQVVKSGQTLADIAVQEYGSWEAMVEIAKVNGISMTDIPEPGQEVILPDGIWNRTIRDFCKANDVSPATARNISELT